MMSGPGIKFEEGVEEREEKGGVRVEREGKEREKRGEGRRRRVEFIKLD